MRNEKVKTLTFMALMAAFAMVATIAFRFPVPATQGYVHFGDTILIISVVVLGRTKGAVAGAFGQAMADLLGGYAIFAPITFLSKLLMGIILGLAIEKLFAFKQKKHGLFLVEAVVACIFACAAMVGVYYFAEAAMYGSFVVPLVEIPANIIQFSAGTVLAGLLTAVLCKTPANRYFKIGQSLNRN